MEKFNTFLLLVLIVGIGVGAWLFEKSRKEQLQQITLLASQNDQAVKAVLKSLEVLEQRGEEALKKSSAESVRNAEAIAQIDKAIEELKKRNEIPTDVDPQHAAMILSRLTDPQIRQYAVRILGCLATEEAEKRVLELARGDPEDSVRQATVEVLRQRNPDALSKILLKQLKDGSQPQKAMAAQGLAQVASKGMEKPLLEALEQFPGKDYQMVRVRRSIFQALRKIGEPSLCKKLCNYFYKETDDGVKYEIGNAISQSMAHDCIDVVCTLVTDTSNEDLRKGYIRSVIDGLAKLKDIRATPAFMHCLSTMDYNARRAAEHILRSPDPMAAEAIVAYYNRNKNNSEKDLVLRLLKERPFPGIVVEDKKLSVVDEEKLKALMAQREKDVANLKEADKRRGKKDIF